MSRDTRATPDCKGRQEPSSKTLLEKWTLIHKINCDPSIQNTAKVIAVDLMWRMNCKHGSCFPKQETIAEATGVSLRSVIDAVKALKAAGYLTWRRENMGSADHPSWINVYRFVFDAIESGQSEPNIPQEPPQRPANSTPEAEPRHAQSAPQPHADNAGPIEEPGKRLSQEDIPTSTEVGQKPQKSPDPVSAEKPTLQEGSPEWYREQIWNVVGEGFRLKFYPGISKSLFKKRLGETLRRQANDYRRVLIALKQTIRAEPGGDAWEYLSGILRKNDEPNYREAPKTRGVM